MITGQGRDVCGRCSLTDEKSTRNYVYEEAAKAIEFPCRYNGCKDVHNIVEMKIHEDEHISNNPCPILPKDSCGWRGCYQSFLAHFEESHPDFIFKAPCSEKPELVSNEKAYLLKAFGYLFLVEYRYSIVDAKLWYFTKIVGDDDVADLFEFSLLLKGSEGQIRKSRKVQRMEEEFTTEESLEYNMNSILIAMGGFYNDLMFSFDIVMAEATCEGCGKVLNEAPIICKNGEYYCENCGSESNDLVSPIICSAPGMNYNCMNCCYTSDNEKQFYKHKIWFCEGSSSNCNWGCTLRMKGTKLFDHYLEHCDQKKSLSMVTNSMDICRNEFVHKPNTWHKLALIVNDMTFLVRYQITPKNFNLYLISNIPANELDGYGIEVCLYDNASNLKIKNQIHFQDWLVETNRWDISLNSTNNFRTCIASNKYKIEIVIYKYCDVNLHAYEIRNVHELKPNNNGQHFPCKNCPYFNHNVINTIKHQQWFCEKKPINCKWGCSANELINGVSLFQHYAAHCTPKRPNDNAFEFKKQKRNTWYLYVLQENEILFLVRFALLNKTLHIFIVSDATAEIAGKLKCSFDLDHFDTCFSYSDIIRWNSWSDPNQTWDFTFTEGNISGGFVDENSFDLTVYIDKFCDRCKYEC